MYKRQVLAELVEMALVVQGVLVWPVLSLAQLCIMQPVVVPKDPAELDPVVPVLTITEPVVVTAPIQIINTVAA